MVQDRPGAELRFWTDLDVVDLLVLCAFLSLARTVAARMPGFRRLAMPPAVLAGALALLCGPSGLELVPLGHHTLEAIVYHTRLNKERYVVVDALVHGFDV